ncbi:DEAD/DEAH box helicase [Planococcus dechangensis]|uniref:DEAD/DEAH box helicase n=1 Tax=Planococcus dechangensis TaxID=1176255 RepID=A0ABV9M7J4_9BACL
MTVLADFQVEAISDLLEAMEEDQKEIVFKSPTGSGKTIMLTHFMDEYVKGHLKTIFIWFTPGKGDLEEQSKNKMDYFVHNAQTKLLDDILTSGFEENDFCFINWERVTKKGNSALKQNERDNLIDKIRKAHIEKNNFVVVIDESHQNDTVKSDDILNLFKPVKVIRTSATPVFNESARLIEVDEGKVIEEGYIKKMLVINEDFSNFPEIENPLEFLLQQGIEKQNELARSFIKNQRKVNPLVIVQLPNNNDVVLENVERYLETQNITYENGLLAVWLNNKKENLENIEHNEAGPKFIIIKQAVATGWDCPRAQVLVKLRDNSDEVFEIQTIGRIRRMPELFHYDEELLDSCYLYTFDEKFTEGVKENLGDSASHSSTIFLKEEYRNIELTTEEKVGIPTSKDPKLMLLILKKYYQEEYNVTSRTTDNRKIFENRKYIFDEFITKSVVTGNVTSVNQESLEQLEKITFKDRSSARELSREYHNRVSRLGMKLGLTYNHMNTIVRRLFNRSTHYENKILSLETKQLYTFVINNFYRLHGDILNVLSNEKYAQQSQLSLPVTQSKLLKLPLEFRFTYNKSNKLQKLYKKNVYEGYLSSAVPRSTPERLFEKECELNHNVEWFYKNGDKGSEYLAIVYLDNNNKQKSFYPDYVICVNGQILIVETKGGFSRYGQSEDIDVFTPKKFNVLKSYLSRHNLKGGIVREDKSNNELFICYENYNDDIQSDSWVLFTEFLDTI